MNYLQFGKEAMEWHIIDKASGLYGEKFDALKAYVSEK